MTFKEHDIVLHKTDKSAIGIVRGDTVEWWDIARDALLVSFWSIRTYSDYLLPYNGQPLRPNFAHHCKKLNIIVSSYNNNTDSLVVQKIKKLDYEWELKMKMKGNFFLTSRALNVDQETISQSTLTDTAIALDVPTTLPPLRSSTRRPTVILGDFDF